MATATNHRTHQPRLLRPCQRPVTSTPPILLLFRWPLSVGYAVAPLQRAFYEAAMDVVRDPSRVGFAVSRDDGFRADWIHEESPLIAFDSTTRDRASIAAFADFVRLHGFATLFGF